MIKVDQLCKYYRTNFPFHGFNYQFENQTKYTISGPSGCGKTTLLRLIAGFESLDGGQIYKDKELVGDIAFQLHPSKRGIGMVFQRPALWPHMTVKDNILYGNTDLGRMRRITEIMAIDHLLKKMPYDLSGGEAKRVSLARMMVLDWQYLLLDEPLANVDKKLASEIISFINDYCTRNKTTLIYVTHNDQEANQIDGTRLIFT